jgi:hypothetical protein
MERAAGADHRSAPAIDKRGIQIILVLCYALQGTVQHAENVPGDSSSCRQEESTDRPRVMLVKG